MWEECRYWLGVGIRWQLRRRLQQTLAATKHCCAQQATTLRRLLALNRDSRLSSEYRLHGVASAVEFRQRIEVSTYERFRPYIDRLKLGETSAMLGQRNRLLMFALSSGTTAATKFIPVTQQFYTDYRRGWQLWGIQAFESHPSIFRGHILQLVSDHDRFRSQGGIPCGNISGFAQHNQNPLVRSMYTVPLPVLKITDPRTKMYAVVRFAAADPRIRLMMTANPSTLVQLAQALQEWTEPLLRDIHDGTLSAPDPIDARLLSQLRPYLNPQPVRANELSKSGRLHPSSVWPELALIAVWTGGSVSAYLPQLRQLFGDVPIRDHGLSASEGRMTIPLENETSSGLLDIESHFFEFIPEREIESTQPVVLLAHELEPGQRYFILLTTSSGLYRYDIHDVVECTGLTGTTPLLRFLHKGAHLSSITGEKISESQVVEAVQQVTRSRFDWRGDYVVAPVWGTPPHYVLWLEDAIQIPDCTSLAGAIDAGLQQLNSEYADKRVSGRLSGLEIRAVPAGTWTRWAKQRQSGPGGSVEQYKHPFLVPRLEFEQELGQLIASRHSGGGE